MFQTEENIMNGRNLGQFPCMLNKRSLLLSEPIISGVCRSQSPLSAMLKMVHSWRWSINHQLHPTKHIMDKGKLLFVIDLDPS